MSGNQNLATIQDLKDLIKSKGHGHTLVAETEPTVEKDSDQNTLKSGALSVIVGAWSSGKTSLALRYVVRTTCEGKQAAIVDAKGWIFPPALALMKGVLEKTLLVQPPPERTIWSAEQVLKSGIFALVLLVEAPKIGRAGFRRLQLAAEQGHSAGLIIPGNPKAPAAGLISKRLQVQVHPPRDPLRAAGPHGTYLKSVIAAPPRQYRVDQTRRGGQANTAFA